MLDDKDAMEAALDNVLDYPSDDEEAFKEKEEEKFKPVGVWIDRPAADQS